MENKKSIRDILTSEQRIERNHNCREFLEKSYEAEVEKDVEKQIEYLEKAVAVKSDIYIPYHLLMTLYKKLKRKDDELRICLFTLELFPDRLDLQKRVRKLQNCEPEVIAPTCRVKVEAQKPTWGDLFFEKWNSLTKDDFYIKKEEIEEDYNSEFGIKYEENYKTVTQYRLCLKKNVEKEIKDMIHYLYCNENHKNAKQAESVNDYLTAARIYETIAAEKLPYSDYYGHIAIYKKFRLREAELESILELQKICKKEEERYEILSKRFAEWFPQSTFAEDYKNHFNMSIGYIRFPPIRTRIYSDVIKRIDWLQNKIDKK